MAVPVACEEQPVLAVLPPSVQQPQTPQVPMKQPVLAVSHREDTSGGVQHPLQGSNPLQPPALPLGRQGTALQPPLDMPDLAATQEMSKLPEGLPTKAVPVPIPTQCQ